MSHYSALDFTFFIIIQVDFTYTFLHLATIFMLYNARIIGLN